ncbi:MAG TPA: SUMF1/EgtB/PvdO family nonheme iron enzyme [Kofleriaceae bacterium]|jgi:hypothetical protein
MRAVVLAVIAACGSSHATVDATHEVDAPTDAPADGPGCYGVDAVPADAAAGPTCTANGIPGECFDESACIDSRHPTAGLCAGAAEIQCCTPAFAAGTTCDPNAHPEPNQCLTEAAGDPGCAPGMVHAGDVCIDKYEAALVSVNGGGPWSPYFPPPDGMRAVSIAGAVPQGFISQTQAAAACEASGKRLCTDDEWLRACEGPAGSTYPYGDTREPGVCNDARSVHPAVELYGTSDAWIYSHLDSPCLSQEANGLATTGSHTGCVTAEGAFDMMGNLHEWTADPSGTFRGGYYVDTVLNGDGCHYVTTAHDTVYSDYSTGFRCCRDLDANFRVRNLHRP